MLLYESIWFNKFCFKRHGERHPLWGVQRYSFFTIGGLYKLLNFRKVTVYFRKLHCTLSDETYAPSGLRKDSRHALLQISVNNS